MRTGTVVMVGTHIRIFSSVFSTLPANEIRLSVTAACISYTAINAELQEQRSLTMITRIIQVQGLKLCLLRVVQFTRRVYSDVCTTKFERVLYKIVFVRKQLHKQTS